MTTIKFGGQARARARVLCWCCSVQTTSMALLLSCCQLTGRSNGETTTSAINSLHLYWDIYSCFNISIKKSTILKPKSNFYNPKKTWLTVDSGSKVRNRCETMRLHFYNVISSFQTCGYLLSCIQTDSKQTTFPSNVSSRAPRVELKAHFRYSLNTVEHEHVPGSGCDYVTSITQSISQLIHLETPILNEQEHFHCGELSVGDDLIK